MARAAIAFVSAWSSPIGARLADVTLAGQGNANLLRLVFRPDASAGALDDLLLESILQSGGLEFVLAEKGELAAEFKAGEIGQAILADAFGAGHTQQYP
jgi:hypothetical protein